MNTGMVAMKIGITADAHTTTDGEHRIVTKEVIVTAITACIATISTAMSNILPFVFASVR